MDNAQPGLDPKSWLGWYPPPKVALRRQYAAGGVQKMVAIRDRRCPMGKMGDVWDVAYVALFLASDEAR